MEAEQENVLWNWMVENIRRGKRQETAARGRWRNRIAWGDGNDQANCK